MEAHMNYRKKPVVIQAMQVTDDPDDNDALAEWLGEEAWLDDDNDYRIDTLEGTMTARTGDWIIKGVQGEFYLCKPEIFAATYDEVA